MTARFVIRIDHARRPSYALEFGPPKFSLTREERKRRIDLELTDEAESLLSLRDCILLFEAGALRGSFLWHRAPPAPLKEKAAKAFARYRERMAAPAPIGTAPDRLAERRRIIAAAQARRDAIEAIGNFCRGLAIAADQTAR